MALIINADQVPEARALLTKAGAKGIGPQAVRDACAGAACQVVSDDRGTCFSATRALVSTSLPPEPTSNPEVAAHFLASLRKEQVAVAASGWLPGAALDAFQAASVERILRNASVLSDARPWDAAAVTLHVRRDTRLCLNVRVGETRRGLQGEMAINPSPGALTAEPMAGSALWHLWPSSGDAWGEHAVTVPPDVYTLGGVAAHLSPAGALAIRVDPGVADRKIAVSARGVTLRRLLWAISVSHGLEVRPVPDGKPQVILLAVPGCSGRGMDAPVCVHAGILLRRGRGYPDALANAALRDALFSQEPGAPGVEASVVWRCADLPGFYREIIARTLNITPTSVMENPDTPVLWIGGVSLSISVSAGPQKYSRGTTVFVPAF